MKQLNGNIKKQSKYQKAFLVSEDTHGIVKEYCKQHNIKINMWVDSILKNTITPSNDKK